MDVATIVLSAFTFAKPFLEKTQEGIARKVGEDIWNLIKSPFTKKGNNKPEELAEKNPEQFKSELALALEDDPQLLQSLKTAVAEAQKSFASNNQQNITNQGDIDKQVNIQNVSGNVSL